MKKKIYKELRKNKILRRLYKPVLKKIFLFVYFDIYLNIKRYVVDSILTLILTGLTWTVLLIVNTRADVNFLEDFSVELAGITYAIIIIDLSSYLRVKLSKRSIRGQFSNSLLEITHKFSLRLSRSVNKEEKVIIFEDEKFKVNKEMIDLLHGLDNNLNTLEKIDSLLISLKRDIEHFRNYYSIYIEDDLYMYITKILSLIDEGTSYDTDEIRSIIEQRDRTQIEVIYKRYVDIKVSRIAEPENQIYYWVKYHKYTRVELIVRELVKILIYNKKNINPLYPDIRLPNNE